MRSRISREAQVGRNREQVLTAARRVFLASGYERATLDAIAEEAGFSKGVVYSQFESKGDLFLALLERRIAERAAQNEAIAKHFSGPEGVAALIDAARRDSEDESAWAFVLLEFRLHALRDPELSRRYLEAHRRTIAGIAAVVDKLFAGCGAEPVEPPRYLAALILAFAPGFMLERALDPRALPQVVSERALQRMLGLGARR